MEAPALEGDVAGVRGCRVDGRADRGSGCRRRRRGRLSCASRGCWCRDRRPVYPSDLTDEQWAVLEPRTRQVMREVTVAVGRPMTHDLRAMRAGGLRSE